MPSEMVSDAGTMEKALEHEVNDEYEKQICESMKLEKGCQLSEESKTEEEVHKTKLRRSMTQRINDTISRRLSLPMKALKKKPEIRVDEPEEFRIPSDGNIFDFDVDQMQIFFSCFNLESRLLDHLREKKVDGRRFSRLTDSDLERVGLHNVVMCFFRDKSKRITGKFML